MKNNRYNISFNELYHIFSDYNGAASQARCAIKRMKEIKGYMDDGVEVTYNDRFGVTFPLNNSNFKDFCFEEFGHSDFMYNEVMSNSDMYK